MSQLISQFALLLLVGVLYEASAYVLQRQGYRHHRHVNKPTCISTYGKHRLCWNEELYPFEGVSDVVNEVRTILSSRSPNNNNKLRELDPEVYNFQADPNEVVIQNLREDAGKCKTEMQELYPQEGITSSEDFFQQFYIVNIPSLRQSVLSVQCNCHNEKCRQAYRTEKLLSLTYGRSKFDIKDFSIQTYVVPDGCECSA